MKHILENKFYWAARSIAAVVVFGISIVSAQVFITEITDPSNNEDDVTGRYLELYNGGSADVDLSTGWQIQRWTNGNDTPTASSVKDLTGTIPAGGFYIICNDATKFLNTYGFDANQSVGTGGAADSNGDDNIALLDASGVIVDMFGVAGEDGSGTGHEFEDGRAERAATVTSGNPTWDAAEWNIDNDSGGGDGDQYAPQDFDPGAWIGVAGDGNNAPIVNAGGDQEVMANATDGTASVTLDGSATVDLDGDAMTYSWALEGTEVSTNVTFTTDLSVGTYTYTLTANDGDLDGTDDVVITVTPFLNAYAVTFNLDMSEMTIDEDGVSISGLGPANIAMMDDDMDGVYTATVDLFEGDHTYNFRNGWAWEPGAALENCATGEYNNIRSVSVVDADVVLDAVCWGSCDACATEEVGGCTDPYALNYDPNATVDDGTCEYDEPNYDCNGYYGEDYNFYNCDNLHLALDLSCSDWGDREDLAVSIRGPLWDDWDPDQGPPAYYDGDGYWVVELDGYPTASMEYQWVVKDTNSFESDETYLEDQLLLANNTEADEWSCTPVTDWLSYAYRAWNPEEDGLEPAGWDDYNWPVDTWGTCVDCYNDEGPDSSDFVYLGEHGGSEYYTSTYSLDWWDANQDIASGNDGSYMDHMLTLSGQSESDFVWNSMMTHFGTEVEYWIGATDEDSEGEWQWVTEEPFVYTNWASDQPDGGANENQAHVTNFGEWADTGGGDSIIFVVEVPSDSMPDPEPDIYLTDIDMTLSLTGSGSLPELDLSSTDAGIKISATFATDTSAPEGVHAAGLLTILYDSNWNSYPDSGDISLIEMWEDEEDGGDGGDCEPCDGEDGCGNYYEEGVCIQMECEWLGEGGPGCGGGANILSDSTGTALLIVDNGPDDENDQIGEFSFTLYPDDDGYNIWLMLQGATWFIVPLTADADVYVTGTDGSFIYHTIKPVAETGYRIKGNASLMDASGEPDVTMGVENMLMTSFNFLDAFDDTLEFDSDGEREHDEDEGLSIFGVTGPSGDYSLGVPDTGIYFIMAMDNFFGEGRNVAMPYPYNDSLFLPMVMVPDEQGEPIVTQDFAVWQMNTKVHGQVTNNNMMPVYGAEITFEYEDSSGVEIGNEVKTDDGGYYEAWVHSPWVWGVNIWHENYQWFEDTLATWNATYSEIDGHNYLNYDPVLQYDGGGPGEHVNIYGHVSVMDNQGNMMYEQYPVWVDIWGDVSDFYDGTWTDMNGNYSIDVPPYEYYWIQACVDDSEENCTPSIDFSSGLPGSDLNIDLYMFLEPAQATVTGTVLDGSGNAVYNAQVEFVHFFYNADMAHDDEESFYAYTDYDGTYEITVPHGVYDAMASKEGLLSDTHPNMIIEGDMVLDFMLNPVVISGSVSGVIYLIGESDYSPDDIYVNVYSDQYDVWENFQVTESGTFYSFDLPDGSYNIHVDASGYGSYYEDNAFVVAGNDASFDVDLYAYGFVGAPHIHDLVDVPNDQGRQMRSIWDHGNPGNDGYFTQFSIWRKVPNVPIDLWDYIATVPWHGDDELYAAVVPTLGDSISPEMIYWSTFMVTAHTEDVDHFVDSDPMSGYSIDNLHPGAPMNVMMSQEGNDVSLTWSGPQDDDYSYHNVYRQDLTSADPAIVFTTVDSFFVDQDVGEAGSWEYWITAVDVNENESDPSGVVSVTLSAWDVNTVPTVYALEQNYPNPFNPSTQIRYALPEEASVTISIYDLMGREVRTLVNDVQSPGYRSVVWNATNDMGRQVSAGVYIYSIQAGDFIQTRKMVLMK